MRLVVFPVSRYMHDTIGTESTTRRVLEKQRKQTSDMCVMAPHGLHLATVSVAMVTVLHN